MWIPKNLSGDISTWHTLQMAWGLNSSTRRAGGFTGSTSSSFFSSTTKGCTGSTFGVAGGGAEDALASTQARRLRGVLAAALSSVSSAASESSEPEPELEPSSSELSAAAASSASEPRSWKAKPDAGGAESTVFRGKHRSCLLVYACQQNLE